MNENEIICEIQFNGEISKIRMWRAWNGDLEIEIKSPNEKHSEVTEAISTFMWTNFENVI